MHTLLHIQRNICGVLASRQLLGSRAMMSATRGARVADDQIKRVLEEVVNDSGLMTDNRMAKYMSELEATLKATLISEIGKVTQPLVRQVAALEDKLETYDVCFAALDSKVHILESKVEELESELKGCHDHQLKMETKIDDSEQYSCRTYLRLIGIPLPQDKKETAIECLKKVQQILGKLQVQVSDKCID